MNPELEQQIRSAFAGVTLGDGIGLWEAKSLDDYADDITRSQVRARDIRDDWSRIPAEDLPGWTAQTAMIFTDPEGLRFLLPVFLIKVADSDFPLSHLTNLSDLEKRFCYLNTAQRLAVQAYLLDYIAEAYQPEEELNLRDQRTLRRIRLAIDEYWSRTATQETE